MGNLIKQFAPYSGIALYIFSVLVCNLPVPLSNERWSGYFFNVAHALAGNWTTVGKKNAS